MRQKTAPWLSEPWWSYRVEHFFNQLRPGKTITIIEIDVRKEHSNRTLSALALCVMANVQVATSCLAVQLDANERFKCSNANMTLVCPWIIIRVKLKHLTREDATVHLFLSLLKLRLLIGAL